MPFEITEEQLERLRNGEPEAEEELLIYIYGYIDSFVRLLNGRFRNKITIEDCEDIVGDYLAQKFSEFVSRYRNAPAKQFSGALILSLKNRAIDYMRRHNEISLDESLEGTGKGDDTRTLGDTLPELQTEIEVTKNRLVPADYMDFRKDIERCIEMFCSRDQDDRRKRILRALCDNYLKGNEKTIVEILQEIHLYHEKDENYVNKLWHDFRIDLRVRGICQKYR